MVPRTVFSPRTHINLVILGLNPTALALEDSMLLQREATPLVLAKVLIVWEAEHKVFLQMQGNGAEYLVLTE